MSVPLRVLMVEDDPNDSELLLRKLERGGFEVSSQRVWEYELLREALQANGWDVVLSDHSMPGFKSADVLALMNELGVESPLIVVSGAIGEQEVVDLLHHGAASYVDKGSLSRLAPMIERVLDQVRLRREHAATQQQLELVRAAVDSANDLICVLESDIAHGPRVLYANAACERVTGYPADELAALGYNTLYGPGTDPEAIGLLDAALASGSSTTVELLHYDRKGPRSWVETSVHPISAGSKTFIAVSRDVTERKRAEEQLAFLALHDPLTGLANRALLEDRLNQALAESKRTDSGVGLLLIDLDGFKEANDTLGHAFGDGLLREFAQRLTKRVRQVDTVARIGGDEFVIVLPGLGAGEINPILQRIVSSADEPFVVDGRSHKVDASVGVALYPADASDALSLLRHADVAMYHAKSQGAHGHSFYKDVVVTR